MKFIIVKISLWIVFPIKPVIDPVYIQTLDHYVSLAYIHSTGIDTHILNVIFVTKIK